MAAMRAIVNRREHCIVREAVTVYHRVCPLLSGPGPVKHAEQEWSIPAMPLHFPGSVTACDAALPGGPRTIRRAIEGGVEPSFSHAWRFLNVSQKRIFRAGKPSG